MLFVESSIPSHSMDVEDSFLLGSLEDDFLALQTFGSDQPSGLLWEPTPSYSLMSLEELSTMPLEYINVSERRNSDPRHHSLPYHLLNAEDDTPQCMRAAQDVLFTGEPESQPNPDFSSVHIDIGALSASFNILSIPGRPSPPLMSKKSLDHRTQSSSLPPPPLSPLGFGSPRLNTIQLSRTASPLSMPTSPRWNRQNLPNHS
ncbi:hypothetical protein GYMLUDRAFT_49023 [Collybiopsis luxurians FD-317 M1]|uniref:Uncharacterized protein n=1 Tax=Collybiopsis luxurians FD-317 M1 TaxID=944289 RepID=A0A0D0BWK2_9AGAR|nr:hypothetical protein GYMLUDRAFT_49023 [Collybiopsis luxurians FD-317 M1]